jgi:hypothetical protein
MCWAQTSTMVASVAKNQHLCQSKIIRVSNCEQRRPTTHLMEAPTCTAVKLELRRAAVTHDLDVAPQHPARVSGAERFHGRFFGCESAGKMDRWSMSSSAVGNFVGREDSRHEAIPVS